VQLSDQAGERGGAGLGILLVHPRPDARDAIAHAVASVPGIFVLQAGDLAQAIGIAARPEIAAIVLSLELPDSHGLATLDALRAGNSDAAVVAIVDDSALGSLAMRRGACAFVAVGRASAEEIGRQAGEAVAELRAEALERDLARRIGERARRPPPAAGSPREIAHDLNNLLQIIMSAAEELREARLPAPHAQTPDLILDTARRGIALTRRLHDMSQRPEPHGQVAGQTGEMKAGTVVAGKDRLCGKRRRGHSSLRRDDE